MVAVPDESRLTVPKVLIVDDSLSVRRALERVLSAKDFEVVAARSGEEALERFDAVLPDLTIADVIMPGIGGFELCRKLRERDAQTPVILISGVGDAQIEQQARAVGAAAVIPKPFSPEDLSAALGAALNPLEPQLPEPEPPTPQLPEPEPEAAELLNTELPDTPDTDLSETDLSETELSDTGLSETEPVDADSDTELSDTDSPVPNAELQGTELNDAGLPGDTSHDADLHDADLQDTSLQASDLQADDLEGDEISDTEQQVEPQAADPTEPAPQPAAKPDHIASLTRFLEKPEVLAATLSDRQGRCLAHVGEYPTDAEALASYSRFLLVASDVLGTHYGADHTNGMVLEFPQYALYLGRVDAEHILSLHLSDAKALSVVRYLMNRTLPELASELRGLQG